MGNASGEVAPMERGDETEPMSAFSRNVFSLLDRTEYRRCESGEDLEDIFRLRYRAYRLNDLVPENPLGLVIDEMDSAPNCYPFGIYLDGRLVSTIRLHHVTADMPISPSMKVYGDVLKPRLQAGDSFIDPSRFAADPDWARAFPQLPYVTLRLAGMACFHFGAAFCISMIREDHAAFYKRVYQSRPIAEPRPYDGVINCMALLYQADVLAIRNETYQRYPFFKSTAMEQRMMFAPTEVGEPAPLTILPTARYWSDAA